MREKLLSVGDDSWIETEGGERAFKVNGKALRLRDTLVLEAPSGEELYTIQEKKLSVRDKMEIERGGATAATVKKALVGIRDRYAIDVAGGDDLSAKGNIVDHEYEIERDGEKVAEVSKRWFRVRDTYGIEVAPDRTTRWCSQSLSASTRWAEDKVSRAVRSGPRHLVPTASADGERAFHTGLLVARNRAVERVGARLQISDRDHGNAAVGDHVADLVHAVARERDVVAGRLRVHRPNHDRASLGRGSRLDEGQAAAGNVDFDHVPLSCARHGRRCG